jgi:hypothetical protein
VLGQLSSEIEFSRLLSTSDRVDTDRRRRIDRGIDLTRLESVYRARLEAALDVHGAGTSSCKEIYDGGQVFRDT